LLTRKDGMITAPVITRFWGQPGDIVKVLNFSERVLRFAPALYIGLREDEDHSGTRYVPDILGMANVVIVPIKPWNNRSFAYPMTALLERVARDMYEAVISISLEIEVDGDQVSAMLQHLDSDTLAVGALLPGHEIYEPGTVVEASGTRCWWNTLAALNLDFSSPLRCFGFPSVGDSWGNPHMSGVEEVTAAAAAQMLARARSCEAPGTYPQNCRIKLMSVPGVRWNNQHSDPARAEREMEKMKSKVARPAHQISESGLPPAFVEYI
jgi:hypothetical protein